MKKLQININDDIVARIDRQAKLLGVTRSALCALWLGQSLRTAEAQESMTDEFSKFLAKATSTALNQIVEGDVNAGKKD